MSLQVHGEQWGAGRVVGAAYWPVVTNGFVFSAEEQGRRRTNNKHGAHEQQPPSLWGPYLRVDNLIVKGQPSGSTSYAPGFPATMEVEAEAEAEAPPAVAVQPYLQWIKSSPICSATAMLLTTTVSLAASTGHLSVKGWQKKKKTHTSYINASHLIRILSVWQLKVTTKVSQIWLQMESSPDVKAHRLQKVCWGSGKQGRLHSLVHVLKIQ